MKKILTLLLVLSFSILNGQEWIDTIYSITTESDITYGTSINFSGSEDTLKLDISYPTDDIAPTCGRPLMVIVHGGAFLDGDKNEGYPVLMRKDFAKRGYVTASVNYRLGQFHTDKFNNCNVPLWNCLNMTDSSEWYRAHYRGIQDVNGAIRFLINNSNEYNINPNNTFIVGESAGGIIALGTGFIDDDSEVLSTLIEEFPDAPSPNELYETNCIKEYGLADNIASMDLSRPDLGDRTGTLNLPTVHNYTIKAVGNFYGSVFNNIFKAHIDNPPALYLYHQPCDLIVPINHSRLFAGYNNCLAGFPTNCGYILNRPFVYGSLGIKNLIEDLKANSIPSSDYLFDNSGNNFNCLQQTDPAFGCHAIYNYWLRTNNMASFFVNYIEECNSSQVETNSIESKINILISPNPSDEEIDLIFNQKISEGEIRIINLYGQEVAHLRLHNSLRESINISNLPEGLYYLIFTSRKIQKSQAFFKR